MNPDEQKFEKMRAADEKQMLDGMLSHYRMSKKHRINNIKTIIKYDVSSSLSDDALAKLQLIHSDCVVIPVYQLKSYMS